MIIRRCGLVRARPLLTRQFGVVQDLAKRTLLENALSSGNVFGGGPSGPAAAAQHLSLDTDVDSATWKSIVVRGPPSHAPIFPVHRPLLPPPPSRRRTLSLFPPLSSRTPPS
jgi:hypothetical protein